MTPDETELMNTLCSRIATEKDPLAFRKLIVELNDLLEREEQRLEGRISPAEPKTR
jgi:hypothetical protein